MSVFYGKRSPFVRKSCVYVCDKDLIRHYSYASLTGHHLSRQWDFYAPYHGNGAFTDTALLLKNVQFLILYMPFKLRRNHISYILYVYFKVDILDENRVPYQLRIMLITTTFVSNNIEVYIQREIEHNFPHKNVDFRDDYTLVQGRYRMKSCDFGVGFVLLT